MVPGTASRQVPPAGVLHESSCIARVRLVVSDPVHRRLTQYAVIVGTATALAISIATAQEPPAALLSDSVAPGRTLPFKPAPGLTVGSLHVVPETTTLRSLGLETMNFVVRDFRRPGAASGNFQWLCFTVTNGPVPQRIWFSSDDEMGAGTVTGILATTLGSSAKATETCPELQKQFRPVKLDNGIWLGSTVDELKHSLGYEPRTRDGWFGYLYTARVTLSVRGRKQDFEVGNSLEVDVRRGTITSIRISQITSN